MKSLKKEVKRLLALFVVATVVMVSVPQEYLTVHAAEISEDGMEFEVPEAEENAPSVPESVDTETGQNQPMAESTETKETEESAPVPEETQTKNTETEKNSVPEEQTTSESTAVTEETLSVETEETTETQDAELGTMAETEEAEISESEEITDVEESSAEESTNAQSSRAGGVPEVDRDNEYAKGYGYDAKGNENKNVEWFIDTNGTLEVTGTGEICNLTASNKRPPWYNHLSYIKAARINLKGATSAQLLFESCSNLTKVDLSDFDTSNVVSTHEMFYNCTSLKSLDLSDFNVENVTSMRNMFYGCNALTSLDLSGWKTSNVTDMQNMFYGCNALTDLDLSGWNPSSVTTMYQMFYGCSALTDLNLSGWDTSSVTTMYWMFNGCNSLTNLDLSSWNTNSVTTMYGMFNGCSALTDLNLSGWDTSSVTTMYDMFNGCSSLASLDLSGWNVGSVTNMGYMFSGCSSLKSLNLSNWNTDKVRSISYMFRNCSSLEKIDISSFNLNNANSYSSVFSGCDALTSITSPANLTKSGIALPTRDGISWRRPDGTKATALVTNYSNPITLTCDRAGIAFQGENYTLQDEDGNPVTLISSTNEKLVDLGDTKSFTFTVVPDTGYTIKKIEFVSGDNSTLELKKGKHTNQYIISPLDQENGYIRDEAVQVEIIPVADVQLSVTYDKRIDNIIVKNGSKEEKGKPETVQVSNSNETNLYVKIDNTGKTDLQEPVVYLISENAEKKFIERCSNAEGMSDAEKTLYEEGYEIFHLGSLHEDTNVNVTARYCLSENDIASGEDGGISWVIDQNGRLKIKGIGNRQDDYSYPQWYEYREQITSAVVEWTEATTVVYLFYECINLEEVDVSGFDTSSLTWLGYMFYGCQNLKSVDLSSIDLKNAINVYDMFSYCTSLTEIKTPCNVNCSVYLPYTDGNKWRYPDGTEITELPQNEAESIAIDTRRAAIRFSGDNVTIKDASGKTIESELLVTKGTANAVTFTIEPPEGYVVRSARTESQDSTIVLKEGTVLNQYIISPRDMENGYIKDETLYITTMQVESYTMNISYNNCAENMENVIIANGNEWKEGRPVTVPISNAYSTSMYLKIGNIEDTGTWFPKITVRSINENGSYTETLSYQNDMDTMNAKEKELSQQGYYIFHLGKLYGDANVSIELSVFYQAQFTMTGFLGEAHIYRYVDEGYDYDKGSEKWRKEEIKDTIVVEKGQNIYLRTEWNDTPDQAYKWCNTSVIADANIYHEVNVTLNGLEEQVQCIRIYENTAIEFALMPYIIQLDYSTGDLADISTSSGVKLSEDQKSLEVYGGDNVSFSFALTDGLLLDEVIDNTGIRWSVSEQGGKYTVSLGDMAMLYNINTVSVTVSDPQNRTALSSPEANCQVSLKFKNTKGNMPVYTGEPIEAASMTVRAYTLNYKNGQKPKLVTLRKDRDFTVSYVNNINAGEAQMIITAMPDSKEFRGSYVHSFTIAKAESPKGLYTTLQVESTNQQYTHQMNLSELFKIELKDGKVMIPTGYRLVTPCDKGEVLVQNEEPVLEGSTITYTIREDAGKSSLLAHLTVIALFDNYQDCELQINIQAVKKQKLTLGGTVTVSDKEYDGKAASLNVDGLRILAIEGTNEPASDELLNEIKNALTCYYTGVDGTIYDSNDAPVEIGTYKVQIKVFENNPDYKSDYMDVGIFKISQRNVKIIADDVKLYPGDTMMTQYGYHTDGLAEDDVISTRSFVSCSIPNTDTLAEYPITVNTAAVKIANPAGKDVTANYIVTGQDGKLVVCEPEPGSYTVTYTWLDPLDPMNTQKDIKRSGNEAGSLIEKPIDPTADGYVFLGWYTDETSTKEWNFDTDIIQGDLTLYAGWSKCAVESGGMALCVQEIMPQTYTGKAIKPAVTVYAADGKTRLKLKKDYTITYKNNTNADTKAFPNEVPEGGIGETLSDTSQGFNSMLPYVIIQGKGNYTGKVYVNFHINPANIAAAQIKYTDQFDEKPGKYATVVTQFKYMNKGLGYNKDYTLTVEQVNSGGSGPVLVTLNTKGQLPLSKGAYQVTIAGKDNFAGEITKTLIVADKTQLLKNAKVTCKAKVAGDTKEKLENGIQPENLVVKMNGNDLTEADYTVECTDNHAIGTATVTIRAREGSSYIGSKSVTFKIIGAAFKANAVQISEWQDALPYTGEALTQNHVILRTNDGRDLVYGSDYIVKYKNNMKKGTATMVFTANPSSGYSGSFNKKFKITPMDLNTAINEEMILVNGAEKINSGWKLLEGVPHQKSGAAPADKVSLQLKTTGTVLTAGKGRDYTIKYTNNKSVSNGTAYMTLKGSGNYTGSIDIYFDITKASLSQLYKEGRVTITSESIKVGYPYSGHWEDDGEGGREWIEDELKDPDHEFKPAITIKDGKTTLKKNVDFIVDYSGNTRGELEGSDVLKATIKGIGNYDSEDEAIELNITVNRRALSAGKVQIDYENEITYTGDELTPNIYEVRYKTSNGHGKEDDDDYEPPEWDELTEGQDYRVEYAKNIAKGTGTIKIIGIGRYTGSISKKFKITSRAIYNKPGQSDETDEDL